MAKNKKNDLGDKVFDYISDKLFKLTVELLKLLWKVFKKGCSNVATIRTILKSKEKYFLLISLIVPIILIWVYKLHPETYILCLNYFWLKGIGQIIKDTIQDIKKSLVSRKYKKISEMFDNKVKVIAVKEDTIILNSFVPYQDIEKQKHRIEHFFNKKIISINPKKGNFRHITIKTEIYTKKKLKEKYRLSEYIKTIDVSKFKIPFLLGVDIFENIIIGDLKKIKHMLISGEIGAGKSTIENGIIQSLMYFNNNIAFFLIDFKRVGLNVYRKFKNCFFVKEHQDFLDLLEKINKEMDARYEKLEGQELEDIEQYNIKNPSDNIPYIVMVIDEIADIKLSMTVNNDRIEELLRRIMNMGRASGIHVIAATQRPSGLQLSTEIRAALISKVSFAIQETTTQKMTGVMNTENLGLGEFMTSNMGLNGSVVKGFYVDRLKENKVFNELKNMLGGVNLDKNNS